MARKWTRPNKRVSRTVAAIDLVDAIPHTIPFRETMKVNRYVGEGMKGQICVGVVFVSNIGRKFRKKLATAALGRTRVFEKPWGDDLHF